ncbi:PREDICTED: uncharacterized protein LOC109129545, partial [Camelina sativa]|uniref:Uncharacterized protein LOC109129545 n=1 Tax=Camelina sativa TaxID=90675 RepID=A0ABM1R2Y5_CAMSA
MTVGYSVQSDLGVACGKRALLMETSTKQNSILKQETSSLTDKSSPERERLF